MGADFWKQKSMKKYFLPNLNRDIWQKVKIERKTKKVPWWAYYNIYYYITI